MREARARNLCRCAGYQGTLRAVRQAADGPGDAAADTAGASALVALADALGLRGRDGAGLLGVPAAAHGRGLREAGGLP